MMLRAGSKVVSFVLLASAVSLSACSKDDPTAEPTPTVTRSTTDPNATTEAFISAYDAACVASNEATAELEQPTDDGGTFPPSPSKEGLRDWAIYMSQLSRVYLQLATDLRAIPMPEEIAQDAEAVVAQRQEHHLIIERMVEAADGGDQEAFSAAYTDWVAAGAEVGRAEEKLGIDCRA